MSLIVTNQLKYKWITYLGNILYHTKMCDFLKWRYLYSDFVCARSTSHFEKSLVKAFDFL